MKDPTLNPDNYEDGEKYEALEDVIPFAGFDFVMYYQGERELLKPRLEALGYTKIKFEMGEYDSFGPLTRVCKAKDAEGKDRRFIYG
jgi:hypothetical protein